MTNTVIKYPTLDDVVFRSLVGSNIFFDSVGGIAEIDIADNKSEFFAIYQNNIKDIADEIGFLVQKVYQHTYSKGLIVAIPAEFDLAIIARGILEVAFMRTIATFDNMLDFNLIELIINLKNLFKLHENILLRQLYHEATSKSISILRDENWVTLGTGTGLYQFDCDQEECYQNIPWQKIYNVPSVVVTGSNGKTTTVTLTKFISEQSGKVVGFSSTEKIAVGNEVIEVGDLSGPYGAATILTDKRVETAVLEVARGGLVRRGTNVQQTNGAVVINVSSDHMGLNGIDNLDDLAQTKFLVHKSLKFDGYHVINLDEIYSQQYLNQLNKQKIFCSQKLSFAEIKPYLNNDADSACFIENNRLNIFHQNKIINLILINDIPLAFNGFALHNLENILIAVALSLSLGISLTDIEKGLRNFNPNLNNKGRFNLYPLKNYQNSMIIVDYAHNPASVDNIIKFATKAHVGHGKITLLIGLTGDRVFMLDDIVQLIIDHQIDYVILKTFNTRLRGAEEGAMAELLKTSLLEHGFAKNNLLPVVNTEIEALDIIFNRLEDNHIYIMLSQDQIEEVIDKIEHFNSIVKV